MSPSKYGSAKFRTSILTRLLLLLKPGEGQLYGNRADLHLKCATRSVCDPQIWTHLCLFSASLVALNSELYDMFTLLALTTPLSTLYHFNFEKPGIVAKAEGILAKLMFTYGVIQLFRAPNLSVLVIELVLLALVLFVFIGTNLCKKYYEPWHCFMHVIPAVWAVVLATYHTPLIAL